MSRGREKIAFVHDIEPRYKHTDFSRRLSFVFSIYCIMIETFGGAVDIFSASQLSVRLIFAQNFRRKSVEPVGERKKKIVIIHSRVFEDMRRRSQARPTSTMRSGREWKTVQIHSTESVKISCIQFIRKFAWFSQHTAWLEQQQQHFALIVVILTPPARDEEKV